MIDKQVGLRERARRAVRGEIVEAAMELFLTQGFEATTVEQIAQAAGISRRSYFRYFASKDEAFTEGLTSIGNTVAQALESRPEHEEPWPALRRAFDPLLQQAETDPRAEALGRLMLERPSLQQDKDVTWLSAITHALAPRLAAGGPHRLVEAGALAAAAIACLHVAQRQWLRPDEHESLSALLDTAMRAVRSFE